MNMTEKQNINIVFASDDNYIQHATVAMMSIMQNTSRQNYLHCYILDDGISISAKEKVYQTFRGTNVEVHFLCADVKNLENLFVSGQLSRAAYLRLQMAELLPESVERVIYLDCDLVVLKDIADLWNIDLKQHPLGAVPDYGIMASTKDWKRKQRELGFEADDVYFNSGVLLVEVSAWRRYNYGSKIIAAVKKHHYQHHDQDALNVMFYKNWLPIPLQWNVIPPVWYLFVKILSRAKFRKTALKARQDIAVLHYAGGYKPWEYAELKDFNQEYYQYFRQTAFNDETMPQPNPNRRGRSIKRQLCRLKVADFWQKLMS